jgi:8-amino-7-oxononanoate synthase
VLDFTSSLYLGLRHPSHELGGWRSLTTGRPAALGEFTEAKPLSRRIAALTGASAAVAVTSALHGLVDVLEVVVRPGAALVGLDAASYALAQIAVERVSGQGTSVVSLTHFDPAGAEQLAADHPGRRLVLVTDGFCPGCGRFAPVTDLLSIARRTGGVVVIDDTQALGIAGKDPSPIDPYGHGGGGTLQRLGVLESDGIVIVASLAKAFGAPLATIAGPESVIDEVNTRGTTRLHASPPALTSLRAAAAALQSNAHDGDERRRRLASRVQTFRDELRRHGLVRIDGGPFPVQAVPVAGDNTARLNIRLLRDEGIAAVPIRRRCRAGAAVALLFRADHTPAAARLAAAALAEATHRVSRQADARRSSA